MTISVRDFFAGHADLTWIDKTNPDEASRRTGVAVPGAGATDLQWTKFWVRVDIAWRWRFADLMSKGQENGI
jgi:hypothetical protein